MKSKISSKKTIQFGKVLVVKQLSSPNVKEYTEGLRNTKPSISNEELNQEVMSLVKRDSFYNVLMDEVVKSYEFDLNEEEITEKMTILSQSNPDIPVDLLRSMTVVPIFKQLIYDDLAKEWSISVSDNDVKSALEQFYKQTGQSIREYLKDKSKFESVRDTLKEQIITDRLMNAFGVVYQLSE